MPLLLILSFLALPLTEIGVFILVGSEIGVGWTLALVVLSTVGGILLVRRQSFATLQAARAEAQAGRVPEREIVHGAMIVLAGLLLILPGFVTDAFGLLLLVPPLREALWRTVRSRVVVEARYAGPGARPAPVRDGVVDLEESEFTRRGAPNPDSPWREEPDRRIEDARAEDGREDAERRR